MKNFSKPRDKRAAFNQDASPKSAPDSNKLPPIFSFDFMIAGNGYSVECCDDQNLAALAKRLFKLSQMTWLDITFADRHAMGSEKISRGSIKKQLPGKLSEDAQLLALRYHGLRPMVGFRDGRVFNVIYLDHDFTLYDHG